MEELPDGLDDSDTASIDVGGGETLSSGDDDTLRVEDGVEALPSLLLSLLLALALKLASTLALTLA